MADSDEDYEQDIDDDEIAELGGSSNYGTRSSGPSRAKQSAGQSGRGKERWEDIQRSWDLVTEGADGSLAETVESLMEAGKRKRLLRDTTPIQRGIIRHFVIIIDMSTAMIEREFRPSRYHFVIRETVNFVREFFEQNPISQLGIIGMYDGLARRISDISGNAHDHISALRKELATTEPKGVPSLQNALEMARAALYGTPTHGTREILVIFGAVFTADPGDIHKTIRSLVADKMRVSVIGLAARMAICEELCSKTNGGDAGLNASRDSASASTLYGVAKNESHFHDLLFERITPPATLSSVKASEPALIEMGFPSRFADTSVKENGTSSEDSKASLCACHDQPTPTGYLCSRCNTKVCQLPMQCPRCHLQLIQSTHLARSYHHLFPLRNYVEVSWTDALSKRSTQCFACLSPFPSVPDRDDQNQEDDITRRRRSEANKDRQKSHKPKGVSESGRYACLSCGEHFCIDCDVFAHETVHNCAGCLSKPLPTMRETEENGVNGHGQKGNGDAMEIDQ